VLKERRSTAVPGTRTPAIQYESSPKKDCPKKDKPLSQTVRQGNRKYTVSPIYKKIH